MDAVIRAVRLGDARTRLGWSLPPPAGTHQAEITSIQGGQPTVQEVSVERAALEKVLRRELAADAQKLFDAEREKGFAAGHEEGRLKAAQVHETEITAARASIQQQFTALNDQIEQSVDKATRELATRATDLAFESVCKIAGANAISRQFVAAIVEAQLQRHTSAGPLTIHLHPDDLALLCVGEESSGSNAVRWTADDAIELGGCLIDTPMGRYDARLETQLAKLKGIFERARSGKLHD